MGIFSPDIGIDLGSTNVILYVTGRGIALRETCMVVVRDDAAREVTAVGEDARLMLGRMPKGYMAVHPIQQGVIADFDMTEVMLKFFLQKALGRTRLGGPRVVVSIPGEVTAMERRAVDEAVKLAGARSVQLVDSAVAAALGSGLPVYEPEGSFIVDVGGGTTEVAVVSMGGIVVGQSIRIAGQAMDRAIAQFVKREFNILIGDRTAEELKIDLGSALPFPDVQRAMVRGRDLVTGLPQTVEITTDQVYEALKETMQEILMAVIRVLERTPPELGADVMRMGIHLTGGSAYLPGLDQLIASETGIQVQVARSPMDCVALGAGYLATNLELLSRIGKNHPLTE